MTGKKAGRRSRDEGSGGKKVPQAAPVDSDPESSLGEDDDRPRDRLGRARADEQTARVDAVTADRRREWVKKAIVQGFGSSDILAAIETDKWGISRRQAYRYLEKALEEVQASSTRKRELEIGKAIERNEMILRKALSPPKGTDVDLRTAVRANEANARLMGLAPPVRLRHGSDPESPLPASGDFIVLVQEVVE